MQQQEPHIHYHRTSPDRHAQLTISREYSVTVGVRMFGLHIFTEYDITFLVNVISDVCSGAKFDLKYFIWSITFYHNYLKQQKLDTKPFLKLYEEANRLANPHGGFRADSGVTVSQFLLATV